MSGILRAVNQPEDLHDAKEEREFSFFNAWAADDWLDYTQKSVKYK